MKTIAFVIGNNDYFEGAQLKCAVNDATAMAEAFRRLGYIVREELNIKSKDCSRILTDFEDQIKDYDASIFYFAGHGFELEGENYLIPIDYQIPPVNKHDANRSCLRLTEVLGILKTHSGKVNIKGVNTKSTKYIYNNYLNNRYLPRKRKNTKSTIA